MLIVMVDAVLELVKSTCPPKKILFSETGIIWSFVHLSISEHHLQCSHHLLGFIHIILILQLVFVMVMVKVVWVVVPHTLPIKKFIIVLIVEILCRLGLWIIHP